jgi:hypothetical protein
MICSEVDLKNKTKGEREPDNINEEEEEYKDLKKKKLEINKIEVIEDSEEDESDEKEVKPIVFDKSRYEYCKESDESVFIDNDEIFINENEIDTTSEVHYHTSEKCPMELQRMEDEQMRQIMKEKNEGLLNVTSTFPKHSFHLKKKVLPRKKIVYFI